MTAELAEKPVYHVEKFLPTECPKCRHVFSKEGADYSRLLGDIVGGEKKIRATAGYDIIICSHCRNYTARVMLESWQVGDRHQAEKLVQEGFVNLQPGMGYGTHTQDHHTVHAKLPGLRVYGISVDQPDQQIGK